MAAPQPESVQIFHQYLVDRFISMESFTKENLKSAFPGAGNFDTYFTKKVRPLLVQTEFGFRVSEYFRKYLDIREFSKHWSQSGKYLSEYDPDTREYLSFQFFLPLANELILKQTLDDLFFTDRLIRRIKSIRRTDLKKRYSMFDNETEQKYFERLSKEFSGLFGGYSLCHVNGRFRGQDLMSFTDSCEMTMKKGINYLFDETTAIIRFIKPMSSKEKEKLDLIRWTFMRTFVDSILESVNGEAEIWLLETGVSNLLHSWSKVN
jgi:hypothetical protein